MRYFAVVPARSIVHEVFCVTVLAIATELVRSAAAHSPKRGTARRDCQGFIPSSYRLVSRTARLGAVAVTISVGRLARKKFTRCRRMFRHTPVTPRVAATGGDWRSPHARRSRGLQRGH